MAKDIKLVISDIDGTLMKINGQLPKEIIETVQRLKEKNVKMVIATGRMYKAALHVKEELGLDTPIICYQGAMIRDENNIYYEKSVSKKTASEIIDKLRSYNAHINLYLRDRLIVENDDKYIKEYAGDRIIKYEVVNDLQDVVDDATKLLAIHENSNLVTKIRDDMQLIYPNLNIVKSTDYYCEFVHPEADKGYALKFLSESWNIPCEQILAIGDQDNDVQMIEMAGIGVSMGNGSPKAKEAADFITETVSDFGFKVAMEKFVL